jgi:hypothetical protein
LGRTFSSGDFDLTVESVDEGLASLTDDESYLSSQGQFVAIRVTVEWTGDGEGTFLADQQVLETEGGDQYRNEPQSAYIYKQTDLGAKTLAKGVKTEGYLVFDIPAQARLAALRFTGALGAEPAVIPLG